METQTHYEHLFEESGPRAEFGLGAGQTNRSSNDVEDERTSTSDPEQNTGHEETTQRNEEDPQTRQSGDGMASQRSTSNVEDQQDNQANPQAEMRTEDADANFQQHQTQAPFLSTSGEGSGGIYYTEPTPRRGRAASRRANDPLNALRDHARRQNEASFQSPLRDMDLNMRDYMERPDPYGDQTYDPASYDATSERHIPRGGPTPGASLRRDPIATPNPYRDRVPPTSTWRTRFSSYVPYSFPPFGYTVPPFRGPFGGVAPPRAVPPAASAAPAPGLAAPPPSHGNGGGHGGGNNVPPVPPPPVPVPVPNPNSNSGSNPPGSGAGGGGGNGGNGGGGNPPPFCTICGGTHFATSCPFRHSVNGFPPMCAHCGGFHHIDQCPHRTGLPSGSGSRHVNINGRQFNVRSAPVDVSNFQPSKIWDKFTRSQLPVDDRIAFDKEASGYALGKHNKLKVQSRLDKDDDALKHVYNTQLQLTVLKKHVQTYDIDDPFCVLVPVNYETSPALARTQYDLFDDYPKLNPEIVAMSNAYRNRWIDQDFVASDLELTYSLLKKNTDEDLFHKCLRDYDQFHPMQQGGSLIFILIMKRIQNESEQHMAHLQDQVQTLKISGIEGEDVDKAIGLLDAAHKLFDACSTPTNNRIPVEWEKNLLDIFQTTSVDTFNKIFADIKKDARTDADMVGELPVFPSHQEITRLASCTYSRLKTSGEWDVPESKRKKSYLTTSRSSRRSQNHTPPAALTSNRTSSFEMECFNCKQKGHGVGDCPRPLNQNVIDKNRQAYFKKKKERQGNTFNSGSRSNNTQPPRRTTVDGKPMIMNKNGVYVLDQSKKKHQETRAALQALSNWLPATSGTVPATSSSNPSVASPVPAPSTAAHGLTAQTPSAEVTLPAHSVQDLIRSLL